MMSNILTVVSRSVTVQGSASRVTRGRSVRWVPFLFGLSGRSELPGPVLVRLLGDLGMSPGAARALIARLRSDGNLTSVRQGRTAGYRLGGDLARGFERLRSRAPAPPVWSGHFYALLYQVPERDRAFRDRLRRAAVLYGFGHLFPGVLISLSDRFGDLAGHLDQAPDSAVIMNARLQMDEPEAARAAAQAWGLPELDRVLQGHLEALEAALGTPEGASPIDGPAALRRLDAEVGPVMSDLLRAPRLPASLYPPQWCLPRLLAAVQQTWQRWLPAVTAHVDDLLDHP